MRDLTHQDVRGIKKILEVNGASEAVIRGVALQYDIDESFVRGVYEHIAAGTFKSESLPDDPQLAQRIQRFRDNVNSAEAKPAKSWTHQDLEALATKHFG